MVSQLALEAAQEGLGRKKRGSSEAGSEGLVLALSPLSPIVKCWTRNTRFNLDPLSAPQGAWRHGLLFPSLAAWKAVILCGSFPASSSDGAAPHCSAHPILQAGTVSRQLQL